LVFMKSPWIEKINPARVVPILIGSVVAASLGLGLWYVFF